MRIVLYTNNTNYLFFSYKTIACSNDKRIGDIKNYRFFMDENNRLYALDNIMKTVTIIIIKGEDLALLQVYTYYDFFDCGYSKCAHVLRPV